MYFIYFDYYNIEKRNSIRKKNAKMKEKKNKKFLKIFIFQNYLLLKNKFRK